MQHIEHSSQKGECTIERELYDEESRAKKGQRTIKHELFDEDSDESTVERYNTCAQPRQSHMVASCKNALRK